jgi:hypothetical protein
LFEGRHELDTVLIGQLMKRRGGVAPESKILGVPFQGDGVLSGLEVVILKKETSPIGKEPPA